MRGHPSLDSALYSSAKEPLVHRNYTRTEISHRGRKQEGSRHRREKRQDSEAVHLVETTATAPMIIGKVGGV